MAPIPADLQDRRVEITGPTNAKMVINALNSGANGEPPSLGCAPSLFILRQPLTQRWSSTSGANGGRLQWCQGAKKYAPCTGPLWPCRPLPDCTHYDQCSASSSACSRPHTRCSGASALVVMRRLQKGAAGAIGPRAWRGAAWHLPTCHFLITRPWLARVLCPSWQPFGALALALHFI